MKDIGFLIKQIHNQLEKNRNVRLREYDLTGAQTDVLLFLYFHKQETISQKDIGAHLGIRHTSTIDIIKNLERKQFILREVNRENARYRSISLTPKGEEAVSSSLRALREEVETSLLAGFSAQEIEILSCYLQRVYENVAHMISE